ncbi:hypothetical protein DL239_21280 [Sedimentitalea sp. CY04]|uniref:DUF4926 domain-containing protein n=1 Tax=Parasedimentitalea denitrificans TaxID=2211118 RepID=A0ABX0WF80_9RHOB|nr:hypothetical protein [Sedimentitalea sp. CY04]NIZ63493.1 hypothetical protein [Sedimentitalea sp. CY04]
MGDPTRPPLQLACGQHVVIAAFDDIPEHEFKITEVFDDCVGGYSLTGPLAGEYGEPDFEMILRVID